MARPRTGSVTAVGEGKWRVRATAGGKRISATIEGTKDEATDALHRMLAAAIDSRHVRAKGSVSDLLDRWMAVAQIADTTRTDWASVIAKHIEPHIGHRKAYRLTGADLDAYYAKLIKAGVSAERVRRVHSILRVAFTQAVKWREVAHNPTANATPPKQKRRRPKTASAKDISKLIAAAEKDDAKTRDGRHAWFGGLAVWLLVAADTGARLAEVCRLRWVDVDLDGGSVRIISTKTDTERRVAIGPDTVDALKRWRKTCRETWLSVGAGWSDDAWVFGDPLTGRSWAPSTVSHRLMRLRRSVGLEGVRIGHLRHHVATELLAAGMDPKAVAGRLGHAKPSTTLDIYAAWVPARDQEAAAVLAALRAKRG